MEFSRVLLAVAFLLEALGSELVPKAETNKHELEKSNDGSEANENSLNSEEMRKALEAASPEKVPSEESNNSLEALQSQKQRKQPSKVSFGSGDDIEEAIPEAGTCLLNVPGLLNPNSQLSIVTGEGRVHEQSPFRKNSLHYYLHQSATSGAEQSYLSFQLSLYGLVAGTASMHSAQLALLSQLVVEIEQVLLALGEARLEKVDFVKRTQKSILGTAQLLRDVLLDSPAVSA